jgi:hypothetical protein
MGIILQEKMADKPHPDLMTNPELYNKALFSAFAIFWCGFAVGISNLVCGYFHFPFK